MPVQNSIVFGARPRNRIRDITLPVSATIQPRPLRNV